MKKKASFILLILLFAYLLLCIVAYIVQPMFVWPMSVEEAVDRPVPPNARLVWATSPSSKVEGWFFPATHLADTAKAPAIMFFHGNNEVIDHCLEFAETYPRLGYSVLLVEYRGYGRSTGKPSREAIRSDMLQFYQWLIKQPEVDPQKIIYHGRSIGGAVAADLAMHRQPAAMILSSTFTSMSNIFWRFGIAGWIAKDAYHTDNVLAQADYPVLVQHGTRDNIIPISDGRKLGRLSTQFIEYDANHDLPVEWSTFEHDLASFLKQVTQGTTE